MQSDFVWQWNVPFETVDPFDEWFDGESVSLGKEIEYVINDDEIVRKIKKQKIILTVFNWIFKWLIKTKLIYKYFFCCKINHFTVLHCDLIKK